MNQEETEPNYEDSRSEAQPSGEQAMLYCPVCSQRLRESRCKLVCAQCGYFMSCADYY